MVRPTRRGFGLLISAVLLFFIGTNSQAGWLFILAALVAGAAIASALLSPSMVRGLEIERRAPEEILAGDDVAVELIARNTHRRRTLLSVLVRDRFLSESASFIPSIGPGEVLRLPSLRAGARRGIYEATPIVLSSSAPFGALEARKTIPTTGRTIVFPRIVPIDWLPEIASASRPLDAASQRAQKGIGHDFLGVREYSPGDSLRHVHWPTTARTGKVMVREFEQEVPRRMGIIVDTWGDVDGPDESALDTACAAAASAAALASRDQHPLALAATIGGAADALGDARLEEALTWLAGLQPQRGEALPSTIGRSLGALGRIDTLIVATPTWGPNAPLAQALASVGDADVQVIVVLIEAHSYGKSTRTTPQLTPGSVDALHHSLDAIRTAVFRVRAGDDLALALVQPAAA